MQTLAQSRGLSPQCYVPRSLCRHKMQTQGEHNRWLGPHGQMQKHGDILGRRVNGDGAAPEGSGRGGIRAESCREKRVSGSREDGLRSKRHEGSQLGGPARGNGTYRRAL
jgi:hypothetical protein